jgi:D-alanine-D-alanine ligase
MMNLTHLRIAVLEGGPGSERDVSIRSGQNVAQWLLEAGAREVRRIEIRDENVVVPADVDLVFNMIHGTFGEDGQLQALLDKQGVLYTGAAAEPSRLSFDKILSKRRFEERGIATPRYEVLRAGELPSLGLPLVVKASREGSSVGVFLVKEAAQLAPALRDVAQYGASFLVEELISGRELTVGILGDEALPIIEIKPKEGFYDFKNKYPWLNPAGAADHYCPAPLAPALAARIQALALAAHRALDLEPYSRVDLMLDAEARPFVLEINTVPGMTESSLFPEAARAAGISPAQLCARIVALSVERYHRAG